MIQAWIIDRLSKAGLIALVLALAAFAAWRTVATVDGWIVDAEQRGAERQDAKWRAEIDRANAVAADAQAKQAAAAAASEAIADAEIERLHAQLNDMEISNAALPGADTCGLDRDRVRLLPR